MKTIVLGLVLAGLLASSGCAGIVMTTADPRPFGGVQLDAALVIGQPIFGGSQGNHPDPAGVIVGVLDFPLSLTVDMVMLPYTIPVYAAKGE